MKLVIHESCNMMNRIHRVTVVHILFLLLCIGLFSGYIYYSYFHYYEGRNNSQNEIARRIYDVTDAVLTEKPLKVKNIVFTTNRGITEDSSNNEVYKLICEMLLSYNIDLEKQVCYIEIRNGQVYRVIYSTWEFSGYTGSFPEYNLSCQPYYLIVNKANNEFKEYNF